MSDTWTITQAAMIIGKPPEAFQRTVERAPFKPAQAQRGNRRFYVFTMRDLVFFGALDELKDDLTKQKQAEIYKILKTMPDGSPIGSVEVGHLRYNFKSVAQKVRKGIEATEKLYKLIDGSGDEPVIKGTDVSAYRIAALHDGMTVDEILADYPSLTREQILAARAYAEGNPKAGRPYPKSTAKRSMKEARADAAEFLPPRR